MEDQQTLVFVEVKRRRNDHYGEPEESVHKNKQTHLVRAAYMYLQENSHFDRPFRFDIVSLGPLGLRHYENAFSMGKKFYY